MSENKNKNKKKQIYKKPKIDSQTAFQNPTLSCNKESGTFDCQINPPTSS